MDNKIKRDFINNEIIAATLLGGLGRGNIYKKESRNSFKAEQFKQFIRNELTQLHCKYRDPVSEEAHLNNIKELADKASGQFSEILVNGRFRIGISQKLINLYLKYLWTLDWIPVPPHCPFDSTIMQELGLEDRWTRVDEETRYREWVRKAKVKAEQKGFNNISEWELAFFEGER